MTRHIFIRRLRIRHISIHCFGFHCLAIKSNQIKITLRVVLVPSATTINQQNVQYVVRIHRQARTCPRPVCARRRVGCCLCCKSEVRRAHDAPRTVYSSSMRSEPATVQLCSDRRTSKVLLQPNIGFPIWFRREGGANSAERGRRTATHNRHNRQAGDPPPEESKMATHHHHQIKEGRLAPPSQRGQVIRPRNVAARLRLVAPQHRLPYIVSPLVPHEAFSPTPEPPLSPAQTSPEPCTIPSSPRRTHPGPPFLPSTKRISRTGGRARCGTSGSSSAIRIIV